MKIKALATLSIASLVLTFSIAPAKADDAPVPVSVVTETVSASPDATLTFESPQVETVPAPIVVADPVAIPEEVLPVSAPVAVAPVEPVQVVGTSVDPVVTAIVPTAPEVAPPVVPAEPVATAPAVTVPSVTLPVIVENPVCVEQNLFTVTAEGDCADAPLGFTVAELRVDALHELNSRNPNPTKELIDVFAKTYLGATSRPLAHQHIVYSVAIPGVVYNFDSNY